MTDITTEVYFGPSLPGDVAESAHGIYTEVFSEPPYDESTVDFDQFRTDLARRSEQPGFVFVLARASERAIGFTFGHLLPHDSPWWNGLLRPVPDDITTEWEGRTFAVIEMAVLHHWRRRGAGGNLHRAILDEARQRATRATLLVRPDAHPARTAYRRWGYEVLGDLRPFQNAPTYSAMTLDFT